MINIYIQMLYTIRYVLHLLLQVRVMTCISRDHIAGGTRGPSDYQQLSSKLWLITSLLPRPYGRVKRPGKIREGEIRDG